MKRASYITLIAVILLSLAAAGWVVGLFRKPLTQESSRHRRRLERLARSHQLSEARRRARIAGDPAPFPIAFAFAR